MKNKIAFLLLFLATVGYSQNWKTDFSQTTAEAIAQNKPIILVFSGSDWCAPCMKLDKTIWQSEAFKKYALTNYILQRADFPKKKQNQLPEELKKQNQSLAEKYNQEGIFPLVVVLDGKGKVLGKESYKNVTPEEYIDTLNSFLK